MVTETQSRNITYTQAINEAMREEMRRDERVFIMGEDIQKGVYGASGGLFAEWSVKSQIYRAGTDKCQTSILLDWTPACDRPIVVDACLVVDDGLLDFGFDTVQEAKRVLWIAVTGDDRQMPNLRFMLRGGDTTSDTAGLRDLVDRYFGAEWTGGPR